MNAKKQLRRERARLRLKKNLKSLEIRKGWRSTTILDAVYKYDPQIARIRQEIKTLEERIGLPRVHMAFEPSYARDPITGELHLMEVSITNLPNMNDI